MRLATVTTDSKRLLHNANNFSKHRNGIVICIDNVRQVKINGVVFCTDRNSGWPCYTLFVSKLSILCSLAHSSEEGDSFV
ncbi:hypothetical protein HBH56_147120 [Parastagonospora nodorum]|uniref:Uncharacterized protein n=1 Tax=Phaeosphaeria nodorum (strain SN15 / ATCC MYA-4574 / FGSC 10173) TaxID=321614 RepID=A0A7U2HZ55_PHANO|nr:hypothetical protein HBH56_147120 [Parastagonospora nodorum]QRC94006.1 hypothetical protein JI435_404980 [Parastagonospora nodorum SN15]KAH3923185.1 hypothetical protein HBH54_211760 [Parastagonospora nodorum]KAH3946044.1 hypothetical protein HBH53_134580 [Parastagonospora nodorum]KAH3983732.1 hypothetical protein HBH52_065460 [Parastagonospora nodorum]